MFGSSPAKKLEERTRKLLDRMKHGDAKGAGEALKDALEFVSKNSDLADPEFLGVQVALGGFVASIQPGVGLALIENVITRCERHGLERSAGYAVACLRCAKLLRENTVDTKEKGRELLPRGLSAALEGDKEQIARLSQFISDYLEEMRHYELSSLLPEFLSRAERACARTFGPNSKATVAYFMSFAEALGESDSAEARALALKTAERAHELSTPLKLDAEERLHSVVIRSAALYKNGRTGEAMELMRRHLPKLEGVEFGAMAHALGVIELEHGQDSRLIEPMMAKAIKGFKPSDEPAVWARLRGVMGCCAGARGDSERALQAWQEIEKTFPPSASNEDEDLAQTKLEILVGIAEGLRRGGCRETALAVINQCAGAETSARESFTLEYQDLLKIKAITLRELGRPGEAVSVMMNEVLERLDDLNRLDTDRHADALVSLGAALVDNQEYEKARVALKGAWTMTGEKNGAAGRTVGNIYLQMGRLFMRANEFERARDMMSRAHATLSACGGLSYRARAILDEFNQGRPV